MTTDPVGHFFANDESRLLVQPTLDALEAQAANADSTRTVASNVIESLRGSDVMRMAATKELGVSNRQFLRWAGSLKLLPRVALPPHGVYGTTWQCFICSSGLWVLNMSRSFKS